MRKPTYLLIALSGLAVAAGNTGCEATPAAVKHAPLPEQALKEEAPRDYDLASSKLFMWPEKVTSREVRTVLDTSRAVDDMEEEVFRLEKRRDELSRSAPNGALRRWREFPGQLAGLRNSIDRRQAAIDAEMRKPEGRRNQRKIDRLSQQIAELQAELDEKTAEQAGLRESILSDHGVDLVELDESVTEIDNDISTKGEIVKESLDTLKRTVEWFDPQPSSVTFRFDSGSLTVDIQGWDLGDGQGPRDFSTADGTIRNATYQSRGVVFEFDVHASDSEVYRFRQLARSKYDDVYGRIFFQGKIVRVRSLPGGKKEVRLGVAKLSDRP